MDPVKCEMCRYEDTAECNHCMSTGKERPMAAGPKEAIQFFKSENQSFKALIGPDAKLLFEYQVNKLAIEALEKQL